METLDFYRSAMPKATAKVLAQKLGTAKSLQVLAKKWQACLAIRSEDKDRFETANKLVSLLSIGDYEAAYVISPYQVIMRLILEAGFTQVGGHANVNFVNSFSAYYEKNGQSLRVSDHNPVCSKSMYQFRSIVIAWHLDYAEIVRIINDFN